MYSNQSFGGTNRGPASMRPRSKRSNIFVDLGFFALAIICCSIVGYQYHPLLTTTGYNVASGRLERIGYARRSNGFSSYRSRRGLIDMFQADFTFQTGGQSYRSSVTSVPLITMLSMNSLVLPEQTEKSGLAVRYDPSDPKKCVPVEVIDSFSRSALATYVCFFIVGTVMLVLAGMSNLTGEK